MLKSATVSRDDIPLLILRELKRQQNQPKSSPDWWQRAAVISSFLSSVVLAGAALWLTSSLQRAQLASTEATARLQLRDTELKNDSDKAIQESKFAGDL